LKRLEKALIRFSEFANIINFICFLFFESERNIASYFSLYLELSILSTSLLSVEGVNICLCCVSPINYIPIFIANSVTDTLYCRRNIASPSYITIQNNMRSPMYKNRIPFVCPCTCQSSKINFEFIQL
jgi:hypothetical protein